MPNLVGIGLSQVPTNSMLGGMAYQEPDRVKIKKLHIDEISQINSEIAETAVDVFVYDTSRDSDGGAWRKRTTDRSWYNETLGTSTRGTRKEFPAVAVIVAEATQLTIYDGDDPNLPMWMVFNLSGAVGAACNMLPRGGSSSQSDITSIACLNGKLVVGLKDVDGSVGEGLVEVNFIPDFSRVYREVSSGLTGAIYNLPISGRNSNGAYSGDYNSLGIVAQTINDVAMTVLPTAPVDIATGLPVPTIAVAVGNAGSANGGVSVIKDDGTVVDIIAGTGAGGYASYNVEFGSNNELIHTQAYNNSYASANIFDDIPSSDVSASNSYSAARTYAYVNGVPDIRGGKNGGSTPNLEYVSKSSNGDIAFGFQNTDAKLSLLSEPEGAGTDNQYSAVAYIASDYNTGWMIGDTEGAFLSDTDTTNLVDTNLVSNGTFDSNTTGWSSSGSITVTHDSGRLKMVSGSGNPFVYTAVTCVVGKRYYFQADFEGSISFHAGPNASSNGDVAYIPYSSYGTSTTKHCFFVATATTMYLVPHVIGSGNTGYIDNVICKLADHDRTRNGAAEANVGGVNGLSSGLATYGTITKSAVATGAELVAYSGWSSSNYLRQPYNSDLAPGTEAYSVTCWFKTGTSSSDQYIFDRASGSTGSRNLLLIMHSGASGSSANKLQWWHRDSSNNYTEVQITDKTVTDDVWHQVVALYDGSTYKVYVDGLVSSVTSSVGRNVGNDGSPPLYIGVRHSETAPITGKLALFRYSKSAPTAEQVKKMYNDEKRLFHENAKATLYGTSNAVTGLAYDESTDIYHVGTSGGRSDFQGLARINNTTTAVTTAISAHDGFIVEQ